MPTLIHLADEKDAASIKQNGIKIGKFRSGIYCMPVLQNFYLSHQWLRELKRRGVKTFVGVYFKVDSKTMVFAGRYNNNHQHITIGEAIKEIQSIEDPLGYEIIIDHKIEAKAIHKIKNLPQNIGWRYQPRSNGKKPCSCEYCIKSSIKADRIRKKYELQEPIIPYSELLKQLKKEDNVDVIENLLYSVRAKKRRGDPAELLFLLNKNSVLIDREFALTLAKFHHKNTKTVLYKLLGKTDNNTREYAADSLLNLYGADAEKYLMKYKDDAIQITLNDWRKK